VEERLGEEAPLATDYLTVYTAAAFSQDNGFRQKKYVSHPPQVFQKDALARPALSAYACGRMNKSMERSRGEIILFATAVFGVWLSIWAVIFVSKWLELTSFFIVLCALLGFAMRDSD